MKKNKTKIIIILEIFTLGLLLITLLIMLKSRNDILIEKNTIQQKNVLFQIEMEKVKFDHELKNKSIGKQFSLNQYSVIKKLDHNKFYNLIIFSDDNSCSPYFRKVLNFYLNRYKELKDIKFSLVIGERNKNILEKHLIEYKNVEIYSNKDYRIENNFYNNSSVIVLLIDQNNKCNYIYSIKYDEENKLFTNSDIIDNYLNYTK
jgi:hypothetical protein